MEIVIERRAEIALRSLERNEQKEISAALKRISSVTPNELPQITNLHRIHTYSGDKLYEYRVFPGNQRLSLVSSIQGDTYIVEDVVPQDKLKRLLLNLRQE